MRRRTRALAILGCAIILSGCAAPSFVPELNRAQTSADKLPATNTKSDFDPETSRLAGQDTTGATYYFVLTTDSDVPCVAVFPANGDWWSGCGGVGLKATGPDGTTLEVIDSTLSAEVSGGAEIIGQSLLVHPGS